MSRADGADTNFRGRLFHRAHGQEKETTSLVLQEVFCVSIVAAKFDLPAEMYSFTHSSPSSWDFEKLKVAILAGTYPPPASFIGH